MEEEWFWDGDPHTLCLFTSIFIHFPGLGEVKLLVETELKLLVSCLCFMVWTSGLCYNPATVLLSNPLSFIFWVFVCLWLMDNILLKFIVFYCFIILWVMFCLQA